ncbi:MAG TPA: ABC transporter permease [Bryobacteraceae bacterium]|nr:ABC transporter permease [Bryobacteraceae bacterium]
MPTYLIRSLIRQPGLALMIVTMLALAIGANTAIFSVAKAVVLTPLPFRDPDRVVHIFEGNERDRYQPGGENYFSSVRAAMFQDWREQCRSFENIAAVRTGQSLVQSTPGGDRPVVAESVQSGDGLFETLGVAAQIGRYFNAEDYATGGARVAVLSYQLWNDRFSSDRSIVGRDILIDGAATTVVGVMPSGFYPTRSSTEPQLWLPLRWDAATKYSPTLWGHTTYARLKKGVTLEQAQVELDLVAAHTHNLYPQYHGKGVVVPVAGYTFGQHERLFWLLLGAVGLVLLIACANIANLMLARSLEREREFAVRAALGASRGAILKHVFSESLILSCAGGLLGAILGPILTRPTLVLLPAASRVPRLDQVHIDGMVLVFTLLISVISGLLFGIVPGLRAAQTELSTAMKDGGRGSSLGRRERHLTDALVLSEVALSVVLLVGAGLLARAFLNLLYADPGFRPAQAVAAQFFVPTNRYGTHEVGGGNPARQQLYDRLERALEDSPGIEAVGITARLPLRHLWNPGAFSVEDRPALPPGRLNGGSATFGSGLPKHGSTAMQQVTPGYFAALGIPLRRGRLFDDRDRPEAPMAAVINETAARKFFPNEDPIGKRITVDMTSYFPKMTIVGIVGDSRMNGMDREIVPQVFWPMAYIPSASGWIVVRSKDGAEPVLAAIRSAMQKVDPDVAITEMATMTGVLGDSLWRQRFAALLVGFFAILAALIASGGLYAVVSYAVARQTREIGVRMALGATGSRIAIGVLGRGLRVTGIGITVGSVLSVAAGRLLATQVPGLKDSPWMLAAVAGLLVFMTVLACLVPVRRALAVDPLTALRSE